MNPKPLSELNHFTVPVSMSKNPPCVSHKYFAIRCLGENLGDVFKNETNYHNLPLQKLHT
ncbi:hypothetical protein GCM10011482_01400 [Enterococcus alcedinis]|uniref:Uncharacterized protein n=1 Tax=Enterococcus alcedinis TaxID=1274384 RepID=A0A917JD12_9ENTE|nr:hypothetical protein GCM10011482_01400 [Enterococcus alcedinis]